MMIPVEISGAAAPPTPMATRVDGWTVLEYESVSSSNVVAAALPVWHAVRADIQTQGRGRFQRSWVSDRGGLWLSAVVPAGSTPEWKTLPLATGLAVCDALAGLGVNELRMRWPNDVLVRNRKLAGLLLDQFAPGRVVAGIGINVQNHPEASDQRLSGQTCRLAELLRTTPDLRELTSRVLWNLRRVIEVLATGSSGLDALLPRINQLWAGNRRVELDLDGRLEQGHFSGVDRAGRLGLADDHGATTFYDASQVRHLTEIEKNP